MSQIQPQSRIFDKVGYDLLHTATCPKLSERSKASLHYQIWYQPDQDHYAISLSKNDSAGGFSTELIRVTDILTLLAELQKSNQPFHATVFKPLYTGKSVNNHCFLAAVLVDQKVIQLHPQTTRLLEVSSEFEFWSISLKGYQNHSNDQISETESGTLKKPPYTPKKREKTGAIDSDSELNNEDHPKIS